MKPTRGGFDTCACSDFVTEMNAAPECPHFHEMLLQRSTNVRELWC